MIFATNSDAVTMVLTITMDLDHTQVISYNLSDEENDSIEGKISVLSKRHAAIYINKDSQEIYDLKSSNGTRRNKLFLKPNIHFELQPDNQICFGNIQAKIFIDRSDDSVCSETESESMLMLNDDTGNVPQKKVLASDSDATDIESDEISHSGLVGSFFYERTVTGNKYVTMLNNDFLSTVANWPYMHEMWFQQDLFITALLDAEVQSSILLTDLTLPDFFLWSVLTDSVYAEKQRTIEQLTARIVNSCADINEDLCRQSMEIPETQFSHQSTKNDSAQFDEGAEQVSGEDRPPSSLLLIPQTNFDEDSATEVHETSSESCSDLVTKINDSITDKQLNQTKVDKFDEIGPTEPYKRHSNNNEINSVNKSQSETGIDHDQKQLKVAQTLVNTFYDESGPTHEECTADNKVVSLHISQSETDTENEQNLSKMIQTVVDKLENEIDLTKSDEKCASDNEINKVNRNKSKRNTENNQNLLKAANQSSESSLNLHLEPTQPYYSNVDTLEESPPEKCHC
ncbi:hypothetical protein GQR58_025297 [Nymphon striatum]|nr:hypothetical protein GQR58_025297 [Nymphon striatum]